MPDQGWKPIRNIPTNRQVEVLTVTGLVRRAKVRFDEIKLRGHNAQSG